MKDLRSRLGRLDLVPRRCRFLPATGLRPGDKVGLRRHRPLDCILRKVVVVVPRPRAHTGLGTQILCDDRVVRRIRVQHMRRWRSTAAAAGSHRIRAHHQHPTAVWPLDCRQATKIGK